jgi:FkbM family methyltransferase
MKFLYGHTDNYVDVSSAIFEKCLKDDGIYIPAGDGERCDIIGNDPYPNILKHIIVIDDSNNKYVYNATKEVNIKFNSIKNQLTDSKNPRNWWKTLGIFIKNPVERLNSLQKRINLSRVGWGGFEYEYPEQLMVMRFLNANNKVLEIGGNIGRVSHIIQTIIDNPTDHVIMECDTKLAADLRFNLNLNTFTKVPIETAALSKVKLYMAGDHGPRPLDDFKESEKPIEVPTISYSDICKKYNIDFDTLVADCEGSLYYIFKEDPDMLNNINIHANCTSNIYEKKTIKFISTS